MRENNKLTSLLKYICITTSVSCAFVIPAKADFDASTFIAGILNYTGTDWAEGYEPWGDEIYYRYDRSAGVATVMDMSTWDETETTVQLSAGEWRLKKNDYGTIYGTSACNEKSGSKWYDNGIVTKSNSETDSGGQYCWCKMTELAGTDGTKHDVSVGSWVFNTSAGDVDGCTEECANACAMHVWLYIPVRSALLGSDSGTEQTSSAIKVASTAYVTNKFSPISTELNTTIGTIETVVEYTITQADRISALHSGKQNRPDDYNDDEKCPDGYNCLLISDANGVPHWWPIITGETSSGRDNTGGGSSSTFDASAFIAGISTTGAWGNEVYYRDDRSAGVATKYDIPNDEETEKTIQLSAGEWRVKKNDYGMIYGTSACNEKSGSEWYDNGIFTKSTSETDSGGQYCWCKMTELAGTDGTKHDVSVGSWVFNYGSADAFSCEYDCVSNCTARVRDDYDFRSAVLGGGN